MPRRNFLKLALAGQELCVMPKFLPPCISIKLCRRAESLSCAELCFLEELMCLFSCELILHISSFITALSIELAVTMDKLCLTSRYNLNIHNQIECAFG